MTAPHDRSDGEILIAGLGSAGRRHLANLRALGWTRVRLYRTGHATLPDSDLPPECPVEHDLDAALAHRPLAVIVANPSALHLPTALAAARAGAHLLIEKPLSHDLHGVSALETLVRERELTVLLGFQFRFNPGLRQLRDWIAEGAIGQVVSVQVHWGEYLPGMHPWEDYRQSYAARRDLGGGVLLTFSHTFDYLRWLVGEIERVSAFETRHDALDVDVETCADVFVRFAGGGSGHVHLDFLQQPHTHEVMIVGTAGTVTWSHLDHTARRYLEAAKRWESVAPPDGFERNRMFLDEMRHFLACLRGDEQPVCTLQDGIEATRIVEMARLGLERAVV